MRRLYSKFPGDRLGVGLLIIRIAAGIGTSVFAAVLLRRLEMFTASRTYFLSHFFLALVLICGSILLILGLLIPSVSILLAVGQMTAAYIGLSIGDPLQGSRFGWVALLLLATISIALFFLGPGAYSIDARLYGRKRILIPAVNEEKTIDDS